MDGDNILEDQKSLLDYIPEFIKVLENQLAKP